MPACTKRGAQWSMADCTRASGTAHHLPEVESEVLQQHDRRVTPGRAGDRTTWMCCTPGLIEPGDRRAMRRPAGRGPQRAALRVRAVAAVERAADHVQVRGLDVFGRL